MIVVSLIAFVIVILLNEFILNPGVIRNEFKEFIYNMKLKKR